MDPKFSKYMHALAIALLLGALVAPLAVVHSTSYTIIGTVVDEQGNEV